ncbi:MAG: molybdate transport system substrate-binding protein [Rhodobacteraceae bacterium]|nr:MAG: molybdate transport system substrate-binding protein [Paracoccaceae bacterium]
MRFLIFAAVALLAAQPVLADITVFAAASLKTALDEIATGYVAETGIPVVPAYGSTPALARQISEGAPADIFLSASVQWMDDLAAKGLIRPESRRELLGNRLVLVAHGSVAPLVIDRGLDLSGLLAGGKLAMAQVDSVPAGQYGKGALENLGLWASVQDSVVQSENVRAALKLVEIGEAPLGIVYASDAIAGQGVTVVGTFPDASHAPIVYPAALTTTSATEAQGFLDYLETPAADAVFVAQGFQVLP